MQDALGNTAVYQYDTRDNLIQQTDADGKQVTYGHDELNRRNRHTQIKGTGDLSVTYGYDPNGNRTSITDAKGQAFSHSYDELNRFTTSIYPAESGPYLVITRIDRTYDPNGNLDTVTETKSGAGAVTDVTSHSYDNFDRLISTTERGVAISYSYDKNGNRTAVISPAGQTTYTYTQRNQVETSVTADGATQFEYYPDNLKKAVTYPNGIETRYTYDNAYRVSTVVTSNTGAASVISQYTYSYDPNGNRTEQQETQNAQLETTTYGYDAADRLETFTISKFDGSSQTTNYTFDQVGNRLSEQKSDNTAAVLVDRVYSYDDSHWVTRITDNLQSADIDYTYDANGNTVQKVDNIQVSPESTKFSYNSRDQLVQTQRGPPGSETAVLGQYDYNYKGQRVRHLQSSRGDVTYYYDLDAVLEERDGNGGLLAHYRYADRLISLSDGTASQYYHQDALGSNTNLTKADGSSQVSYRLDPWGHIREQVGTSVNRQIFTGQEHDTNSGLIYFGARFYDPDIGRFINQDSYLGEPGTPPSLHRYLYAYGNPLVYVDLYGYESIKAMLEEEKIEAAKDESITRFVLADMAQSAYSVLEAVDPTGYFESYNERLDEGKSVEGALSAAVDERVEAGKVTAKQVVEDPAGGAVTVAMMAGNKVLCKGVCDKIGDKLHDVGKKLGVDSSRFKEFWGKKDGPGSTPEVPDTTVVDKSWKLKIEGTAQRTGDDAAHQIRTYREAIKLAKKPDVVSVNLDHGYNRALGLDPKTISPNRRPDVTAVYSDGRVARVEVQSKTDVPAILRNRNAALDAQLRAQGYTPLPPKIVVPTRPPKP